MKRRTRPARLGRKYSQLPSETIVLDRVAAGTLRIDCDRGAAYRLDRRGRWRRMHEQPSGRTGRYRFIRLYAGQARRAVALHRAVWMVAHGREIPPAYDIDHRDLEPANNAIGNLRLRKSYHNQRAGALAAAAEF